MNQDEIKNVYKQLKDQIDQLMDNSGIDFVNMSKVMHQLAQDFDSPIKRRYP